MNISQIVHEVTQVEQRLAALGGELDAELEQQLAEIEAHLTTKTDSYAAIIDRLDSQALFWKEREETLRANRKACETAADRLRQIIKDAMFKMKKMEVMGTEQGFRLVACAPRLCIDNQSELPAIYKKQIVVEEVDTKALKADLAKDLPVPGAHLEGGSSLRIVFNTKGIKK